MVTNSYSRAVLYMIDRWRLQGVCRGSDDQLIQDGL